MRIMVTGGGTGGHVFPAVAVIEELAHRDPELVIQWVGKKNSMEERAASRMEVPFRSISVMGWPRKRGLRQLWAALVLLRGFWQAFWLIRSFRPDVVLGVGGYVSLPLAFVAERMGIKVFIHEQNRRLGMANRILARRAVRVLLSFPDTLSECLENKGVVVGNPVRAAFLQLPSSADAKQRLDLCPDLPVILVVGGSQGANRINRAVADAVLQMRAHEAQVVWATGSQDAAYGRAIAEKAPITVRVFSFLEDMATACAAADIVVARAGATFTAELAMAAKPSILIPYPYATEGHQEQNARAFVEKGAALLLDDEKCNGDTLLELLRELLNDPLRREKMGHAAGTLAKPHATERIVEEILRGVFEKANNLK